MEEEVLEYILNNCYKEGDYTLSSGEKSNHYVNCKPLTLSGGGLYACASLVVHVQVRTERISCAQYVRPPEGCTTSHSVHLHVHTVRVM